jgi:hypothetical protein
MNNEIECIKEERPVDYLKMACQCLPGGTEEDHTSPESGLQDFQPRFKSVICRIPSRNGNHIAGMF